MDIKSVFKESLIKVYFIYFKSDIEKTIQREIMFTMSSQRLCRRHYLTIFESYK